MSDEKHITVDGISYVRRDVFDEVEEERDSWKELFEWAYPKYFIMNISILDWGQHDEADDYPWFKYDNKILLKLTKDYRSIDVVKDLKLIEENYMKSLNDGSKTVEYRDGEWHMIGGRTIELFIRFDKELDNTMEVKILERHLPVFEYPYKTEDELIDEKLEEENNGR